MINNLFLICSILVLHPDHTEYIQLKRCKLYERGDVVKLLTKYGIDPYNSPDIVLSPLYAEQERIMREGMDDEE